MKHLDIILEGSIQNIGLTFQTMKAADEYHIFGYAMYLNSQKLKIEAEGEEEDLNNFIQWFKEGVPEAGSIDLEISEGTTKYYNSFTISNTPKLNL